jgi:TolB-like protein/Tfp pilus assembly protein PilF
MPTYNIESHVFAFVITSPESRDRDFENSSNGMLLFSTDQRPLRMPELPGGSFLQELKRRNVFRVAIAFILVSWMVLQVVDVIVPMLGLPQWVGKTILLLMLVAFPITLVLAWVLELTPQGVKFEKDVDRSESISGQTGRRLDMIIIGVLATGLVFSLYLHFVDESPPENSVGIPVATGAPSIAVLPFKNRSANNDDTFFVDGIHDDLLTHLAKISSLKVISRTSVLQYRDTTKSMKDIGEELGVSTLLEGSVQRAGDQIRINVQLIDARTDEHLWAEIYDRKLTASNIFKIQEEISAEIAGSLNTTLSPDDMRRLADRPTENLEAYEAYLVGRQKMANRNVGDLRTAVDAFQNALQLDPDFVLAYVGLAESYMMLNSLGEMSKADMLGRVRPLADAALELDPQAGGVYNVLGAIAESDGDIAEAETYYRKAIDLNPEYSMARQWLGLMLWNSTGRLEESADLYRETVELDPLGAQIRSNYGTLLTYMGDIEGGLFNLRKANEIDPGLVDPYSTIGDIYFYAKGDAVRAMLWHQKAVTMDLSQAAFAGSLFAALGDFETAREWIASVRTIFPNQPTALSAAIDIAIAEGESQNAYELAEFALEYSRDSLVPSMPLYAYRNVALQQSRADDAYQKYLEFYPDLADQEPEINNSNVVAAIDLVLVLQRTGKTQAAANISRNAEAYLAHVPSGPFMNTNMLRAELSSLNGDAESALVFLQVAMDENWLGYWWASPDRNPNFAMLHDHQGYQAMMAVIRENLAAQLTRIRELQAEGRLATHIDQLGSLTIELPVD